MGKFSAKISAPNGIRSTEKKAKHDYTLSSTAFFDPLYLVHCAIIQMAWCWGYVQFPFLHMYEHAYFIFFFFFSFWRFMNCMANAMAEVNDQLGSFLWFRLFKWKLMNV